MILLDTYRPSVNHAKVVFNYMHYGYYFNPYFGNRLTKSTFKREYYTHTLIKRIR